MAYNRNIKNHARDFWARDISCAKIVKLLQEKHPIDCVNMNRSTIERWRDQENWDDFAKRVRQNYEEKHVAKVVDQLRKEELEDLQALKDVQAHIVSRLSEGITSIWPEWLRICFFLKVGQTLVAIELDGGQMVPLTTETPFAP